MKKRLNMLNKKADSIILETTIFLVLNTVFIVLLLLFVYSSSNAAFVYEQVYAKQIALLIDNAEPGMSVGLDMGELVKIAQKNKKPIDKIVSIDEKENKVIVSLSNRAGHSFQYFSDYNIELIQNQNRLSISASGKN
jgi:hypothetical protein